MKPCVRRARSETSFFRFDAMPNRMVAPNCSQGHVWYKASKLGEFQPVTVRFSEEVGEILIANRKVGKRHPNFKYYI